MVPPARRVPCSMVIGPLKRRFPSRFKVPAPPLISPAGPPEELISPLMVVLLLLMISVAGSAPSSVVLPVKVRSVPSSVVLPENRRGLSKVRDDCSTRSVPPSPVNGPEPRVEVEFLTTIVPSRRVHTHGMVVQ